MFYLPRRSDVALNLDPVHKNASVLFMATPDFTDDMAPSLVLNSDVMVIDDTFVAGSENRFTLRGAPKKTPVRCLADKVCYVGPKPLFLWQRTATALLKGATFCSIPPCTAYSSNSSIIDFRFLSPFLY